MFAGCHLVVVCILHMWASTRAYSTLYARAVAMLITPHSSSRASTCTNYNCFKTTFYGLLSEHKSIISGAFRSWCFFIIICEYDLGCMRICQWVGERGECIMLPLLLDRVYCDAAVIADGTTSWYIQLLVGWISNFRFYFIYAFKNWLVCQILYFFK